MLSTVSVFADAVLVALYAAVVMFRTDQSLQYQPPQRRALTGERGPVTGSQAIIPKFYTDSFLPTPIENFWPNEKKPYHHGHRSWKSYQCRIGGGGTFEK